MKKVILLAAITLCILLCTYVVQNYSGSIIENNASFRINNPSNLISFVQAGPLTIKQGENYDTAFGITNLLDVYISYGLEYSNPDFSLNPSENFLFPGQNEAISITVSDSGCAGPTSLDVYLYADFCGGSARLKTTLSVYVEEGE